MRMILAFHINTVAVHSLHILQNTETCCSHKRCEFKSGFWHISLQSLPLQKSLYV